MKNFSIFKNSEIKNDKMPTHSISLNVSTTDKPEYITCGACWTKEGKNGKFLSCKLQDSYADHTKNIARKGFILVQEGQTELVENYDEMPDPDAEVEVF
jgi:hypothetical protein